MSATLAARNFLERSTGAFLHYLHIDLAIAGLVLVFVVAGAMSNRVSIFRFSESVVPNFSASAQAPASQSATERLPRRLTPAMTAALDQVVQRYRVSPEALLPVFEAAQAAGRELRLDPLLIIAVISIESRFNPISQSPMGAQGLMQIMPRYHQEKLPKDAGNRAFFDPVTNVQMGARILQEAIQRQGGLMEGLQSYAGASDDTEQAYANKVIAEKNRLEQAPRRKEGASV
jgi:soluble lytic murein transglycosylase-like protein